MFVKYQYKLPKLTERAVINREWIKILFAWILEKKKKVNTVLVGWVKLLQIFVLWKLNKSYCYTFHIMFCVMYKRKLRINTHTHTKECSVAIQQILPFKNSEGYLKSRRKDSQMQLTEFLGSRIVVSSGFTSQSATLEVSFQKIVYCS